MSLETTDAFDSSIYPEGQNPGSVNPDGSLRSGSISEAENDTRMTFKSKRARLMRDGKLEVTGDLVLTRVERNPTYTRNDRRSLV